MPRRRCCGGERVERSLPAVRAFVEGTMVYTLSRMWADLLTIWILVSLKYQAAGHDESQSANALPLVSPNARDRLATM